MFELLGWQYYADIDVAARVEAVALAVIIGISAYIAPWLETFGGCGMQGDGQKRRQHESSDGQSYGRVKERHGIPPNDDPVMACARSVGCSIGRAPAF